MSSSRNTVGLFTFTESEMTHFANQAKQTILFSLEKEGFLTRPAQELCEEYVILVHKKGWFGTCWDKWRGIAKEDAEQTFFAVLKTVTSHSVSREKPKEEDLVSREEPKEEDDGESDLV